MSAQLPMVTPDIHITRACVHRHMHTCMHTRACTCMHITCTHRCTPTQAHTPYHTLDFQKTGRWSPCLSLPRHWTSVFLTIKYLLNRDDVLPASQVAEGSVGTGRVTVKEAAGVYLLPCELRTGTHYLHLFPLLPTALPHPLRYLHHQP